MSLSDWAEVLTIVSGTVLALAAVFAFVLQRSNYLIRTYPQVSVESVDLNFLESSDEQLPILGGIGLSVEILNQSSQAVNIGRTGTVTLMRFGDDGERQVDISNAVGADPGLRWEIPPKTKDRVRIQFNDDHRNIETEIPEIHWYAVHINIDIAVERDLFYFLIAPCSLGVRKTNQNLYVELNSGTPAGDRHGPFPPILRTWTRVSGVVGQQED